MKRITLTKGQLLLIDKTDEFEAAIAKFEKEQS